MRPGSVGLVSQSGGNLYELSGRLADHGHGVSRAVSVGNQADLTIADYLSTFAEHPETRAVVAYVEDFRDGRALFSAVDRVVAGGKPVVLLVPGGNEAVKRAASSHTGALVSNDALIEAACADSGALRVRSVADAIAALRGILSPRRAAGRRVAVVSDVGGGAVLGADAVIDAGLIVPSLSQALQEAIRPSLGPGSGITNPIDAVGIYSLEDMLPAVEAIAASGEVDSIFMTGVLNNLRDAPDARHEEEVGKRLADVGRRQSLQLVVSSSLPDEPALRAIAKEGTPTFLYAKDAAQCLRLSTKKAPRRNVPGINNVPRKLPSRATDYFAARALFTEYGVNLSTARAVRTIQEALAAAGEIGYPVALKGLGCVHKSDSGAVALNLRSEAELAARFEEMEKRLAPPEFSVEQMVDSKNAVEILVGALRDRSFGPTVAVGIGGIFAEIVRDTVVALAPVTEAYARDMLLQLRGAAILQGFRGRPKPDLDALARNVAAVSRLIAEYPEISEAELNPVLAMPTGVVAVDARIALVS
ncbi:MAG: acetate--CoA ligase family protein [Burkholderiales bacterium]